MSGDGSAAVDEVSERSTKAARVEHLTVDERVARGKAARAEVPRSAHAAWEPSPNRVGPVDLLEEQAKTRVPELVPIRYGRMLVSPFTFYRGAALVMAADLADTARTGLQTQLCGDAHLSNFGAFAAPDRRLVFSVNDFDETLPGPFEWDVKRLAASFAVAGRDRGFDDKQREAVNLAVGKEYREAMSRYASTRNLDLWYSRVDVDDVMAELQQVATAKERKRAEQNVAKTRTKDSLKAFAKLTKIVDGEPRIIGDPPVVTPIEDLFPADRAHEFDAFLHETFRAYRRTLPVDRRKLLERYRYVHAARKVVGVGSVGTRAFIVLLLGRDDNDPLFLQFKEAEASVLERFLGKSKFTNHGQRVVEGQRVTQAASDIMLGFIKAQGVDGIKRDFYIRQLWDEKGSALVELMEPTVMIFYAKACSSELARAHARAGDAIAIASYLGTNDTFDRALALFAETYADQNERDFNTLTKAVSDGKIKAETGV
jgi:Uncharacterized protein conserved in bacteria (DUF2252)